jgi:hypothetical protein
MAANSYRRRATGELAIDPALYQLVMHSGALLDRLLCACSSPIPEAPPAPLRRDPARTRDAGGAPGTTRADESSSQAVSGELQRRAGKHPP